MQGWKMQEWKMREMTAVNVAVGLLVKDNMSAWVLELGIGLGAVESLVLGVVTVSTINSLQHCAVCYKVGAQI